jgi:hypothetical protein
MVEAGADISVVICTRNRAESLRQTLACLAATDQGELRLEVVVVDNASGDESTRRTAESFADRLRLRYLFEARTEIYGKSHALNRALAAGGLGPLIAVLDDDMSVEPGWCQGVLATSRRWPGADFFSGRTQVLWPSGPIPPWALHCPPAVCGWLFSAGDRGAEDFRLEESQCISGNFFWFRSRVLAAGRRFSDTWLTEPEFQLQLVAEGHWGVQSADAVAGHRIQRDLLEPAVALERAVRAGRGCAALRLRPYRLPGRGARPGRLRALAALISYAVAWLVWSWHLWRLRAADGLSPEFASRLFAVERKSAFQEAAKILTAVVVHGHPPPV